MKTKKVFAEGQAVEIIPEPMGYRHAKVKDGEWQDATYELVGTFAMQGWHFVTCKGSKMWIPAKRIRSKEA